MVQKTIFGEEANPQLIKENFRKVKESKKKFEADYSRDERMKKYMAHLKEVRAQKRNRYKDKSEQKRLV
jgi:hypothetical protein